MSRVKQGDVNEEEAQRNDDFLISDYEFFQKGFELWANHFMGVFYLWTGTVIVPTTAGGLLIDLGVHDSGRSWLFSLICIAVGLIGWFISLKMFDIRKAQINYIAQMNLIRASAYERFGITDRYSLQPYGKDSDLKSVSRRDFGLVMAIVMSLINGIIFAVGITTLVWSSDSHGSAYVFGALGGFVLMVLNLYGYFRLVVGKVPGKELWAKSN